MTELSAIQPPLSAYLPHSEPSNTPIEVHTHFMGVLPLIKLHGHGKTNGYRQPAEVAPSAGTDRATMVSPEACALIDELAKAQVPQHHPQLGRYFLLSLGLLYHPERQACFDAEKAYYPAMVTIIAAMWMYHIVLVRGAGPKGQPFCYSRPSAELKHLPKGPADENHHYSAHYKDFANATITLFAQGIRVCIALAVDLILRSNPGLMHYYAPLDAADPRESAFAKILYHLSPAHFGVSSSMLGATAWTPALDGRSEHALDDIQQRLPDPLAIGAVADRLPHRPIADPARPDQGQPSGTQVGTRTAGHSSSFAGANMRILLDALEGLRKPADEPARKKSWFRSLRPGSGGKVASQPAETTLITVQPRFPLPDPSIVWDPKSVIMRFGHATHADPDSVEAMGTLGVCSEGSLGSNGRTGSIQRDWLPTRPALEDYLDPWWKYAPDNLQKHQLILFCRYTVPLILSTDGQGVENTRLKYEYAAAMHYYATKPKPALYANSGKGARCCRTL
ncbi:MAG TPA: hypothetical protein VD886_13230 [Herpetosiphonaceae bacterium]|nr:hypothetical protein [Herpetosiphonaceae bacterium]